MRLFVFGYLASKSRASRARMVASLVGTVACLALAVFLDTGGSAHADLVVGQRLGEQGGLARLAIAPDGGRSVVSVDNLARRSVAVARLWRPKPGERFGAAARLGVPRASGAPISAAVAEDGSSVVLFAATTSRGAITAASFDGSGQLTGAQRISRPSATVNASILQVAASGAAVVAWTQSDGSDGGLYAAIREAGSRVFGPSQLIGVVGEGSDFVINIGDDGTVVACWTTGDGGDLKGSIRPTGGSFGAPATLGQDSGDIVTAAGPGSTGLIVWQKLGFDRRNIPYEAWYAVPMDHDGAHRSHRLLSTRGELPTAGALSATIGPNGRALVAFAYTPHARRPASRDRDGQLAVFGGSLNRLARVATLGRNPHSGPRSPLVAIAPNHSAIVAWIGGTASVGMDRVVIARRVAGHSHFDPSYAVSPSGRLGTRSLLDLRATRGGTGLLDGVGPPCAKRAPCALNARRIH